MLVAPDSVKEARHTLTFLGFEANKLLSGMS
jgi:hypothetical protein